MVHHSHKKLIVPARVYSGIKKAALAVLLCGIIATTSACTLLTKPLDSRTGLSDHLAQLESDIRQENWQQAKTNLDESQRAWKKIKPLLQIDIDHDYIKDIEEDFTKLSGYLDTQDSADSLVTILLLRNTWENIDNL